MIENLGLIGVFVIGFYSGIATTLATVVITVKKIVEMEEKTLRNDYE